MSAVVAGPALETFAKTYLLDSITECLLVAAEPLKVSEILASIQQDGAFTSRLLRAVMEANDRFRMVDRRWTVCAPVVDPRRPLEANVEGILHHFGRPLLIEQIAQQLGEGLGKPAGELCPAVRQVLVGRNKYFQAGEAWGLSSWLLDLDKGEEEEILFRNFFLAEEELERFQQRLGDLPWNPKEVSRSASQVLQKAGEPVPNKVLQFLAWKGLSRGFHPEQFFKELLDNEEVLFLSSGHWCSADLVGEFIHALELYTEQLVEAGESPAEESGETRVFQVTAEEFAEIAAILADRKSHRISEIIESIYELSPGERDYNAAFSAVWGAMGADERFAWVGGERWRLAGTVPRLTHKIPEMLELPGLPYFVNDDGEYIDVEIAEEGFEGDLLEWVKDPRVMIAGQPVPEGTVPAEAPSKVSVPIRYEHRLAGTVPVYGDLRALLPSQPDIVEVTLFTGGKSYTGWLNNANNLILELGPFFDRLDLPLCGGVFSVQPRGRGLTTDYTATYTGEVDELLALSDERVVELEAMREGPEDVRTSTFDLMRKIMAPYGKKGLHFVTLFAEVNVVRRTHAYLIASLLSAYACFSFLRAGSWAYDEKKVDQGIRKQKRKFIKR